MAIRSLGLEAKQGVAFYNFDDIPSNYEFITAWYEKLNNLDLNDEQRQAIVDEANLVFDLNIGILEELDGSPLLAMFMLAVNSLKEKLGFQ
jgi:heme oxygenase